LNTFVRRNKLNIFLLICCLPIFLIAVNLQIINVDGILESNFLSVNSIFAGFLFTSLGIIASILDKEIIVFLDERGYLDGYINGIVIGLIMHITSAITELMVNNIDMNITLDTEVLINQIVFMFLVAGIVFFIKSLFNILKLIKIIRNQNKK